MISTVNVAERIGVIARPQPGDHREDWGVLNPGGCTASDGTFYLFPRLVAEGNYSRIGIGRLVCDATNVPTGMERVGLALEPQAPYEFNAMGGGVEDPRVTYIEALNTYVMAYTAYAPFTPHIALAVSRDLLTWTRLGLVHFAFQAGAPDLNDSGNKDCVALPEIVNDPAGEPSIAFLHRPTIAIEVCGGECRVVQPPCGVDSKESIWISFVSLREVLSDVRNLRTVRAHRPIMQPQFEWENIKIGAGAPPIPMPYGLFFVYHAVCENANGGKRYCAGIAILDREDPTRVLYRSPEPVLVPSETYEETGTVAEVVFPTALRPLKESSSADMFYGAADRVIAAARLRLPEALPR